jgi:hypothetical protein
VPDQLVKNVLSNSARSAEFPVYFYLGYENSLSLKRFFDSLKAIFLTAEEQEEWKGVIKMEDYLTKGRRPQFWEETFTKKVSFLF